MCTWDLNEAGSRHPKEVVGKGSLLTRRPSYTSEGQVNAGGTGVKLSTPARGR